MKAADNRVAHDEWIRRLCKRDIGGPAEVRLGDHAPDDLNGDTWWWWAHRCMDGIYSLGRLDVSSGRKHSIAQEQPMLTINGSILCTRCDLHGYVTNGKWVPAELSIRSRGQYTTKHGRE